MRQKALLGIGVIALILLCSGIAFWLGRAGFWNSASPSEAEIDVEPVLAVGSRVEVLSADGWQLATIREVDKEQALVVYQRDSLGEERIDVRLIRKAEAELLGKSLPPAPPARPQVTEAQPVETDPPLPTAVPPTAVPEITPAPTAAPATAAPPTELPELPPPRLNLGSSKTSGSLARGIYRCDLDMAGITREPTGTFADDEAQMELSLTIEIVSDKVYRAFGEADDKYSYDPRSGRLIWKTGPLAREKDAPQYQPESRTIITSMGGHALTCVLEG